MIEHDDLTTHRPDAYTPATLRTSSIAAAAERATKDLARHDRRSQDTLDLARWEGEGGAAGPRARLHSKSSKLRTMRAAMAGRPSYDSSDRSLVEAVLSVPTDKSAESAFIAGRASASSSARPSKLQTSWRDTTTNPTNKRRGRRTMGRHGNRS